MTGSFWRRRGWRGDHPWWVTVAGPGVAGRSGVEGARAEQAVVLAAHASGGPSPSVGLLGEGTHLGKLAQARSGTSRARSRREMLGN